MQKKSQKKKKKKKFLNTFFSSPVKNLKIPEFEEGSPFAEKNYPSDIESNFQI